MPNSFSINSDFTDFINNFLAKNSQINLISKNDEKFLYEKHIYDSLGIKLFFEKYKINSANILDIGCGGGFPCIPIAIEYPNMKITGIDSIRKKINTTERIKDSLKLTNLNFICGRVEEYKKCDFDIVVSRAVGSLAKITQYALPHLKENGYFIAYKSKKIQEEIEEAKTILAKANAKIVDILEYKLPLEEIYERNLVIIQIK